MPRARYRIITVGFLVVIVFAATALVVLWRISAGIEASVLHNSAKHTSATIVSVTAIPQPNTSLSSNRGQLHKVCFTIDDFAQIEADMRPGYQSAEVKRLAEDGPRCKVTSNAALATSLHAGEKLSVIYLLENDYQIDLVAITAHAKDI